MIRTSTNMTEPTTEERKALWRLALLRTDLERKFLSETEREREHVESKWLNAELLGFEKASKFTLKTAARVRDENAKILFPELNQAIPAPKDTESPK